MTIAGGTVECCIKAIENGISLNIAGGLTMHLAIKEKHFAY